jgi:hypothetical protein
MAAYFQQQQQPQSALAQHSNSPVPASQSPAAYGTFNHMNQQVPQQSQQPAQSSFGQAPQSVPDYAAIYGQDALRSLVSNFDIAVSAFSFANHVTVLLIHLGFRDTMTRMPMLKRLKPRSKIVHLTVVPMTRRNLLLRPKQLRPQASHKPGIINTITHPSNSNSNSNSLLEHLLALPPNSTLVCNLPRCPTHTIPTTNSMVNCHRTTKTRHIHMRYKRLLRTILFRAHNSTKLQTPERANLSIQCKVVPEITSPQVRIPCRSHMATNNSMRHNTVSEVLEWLRTTLVSDKSRNQELVQARFQMDK